MKKKTAKEEALQDSYGHNHVPELKEHALKTSIKEGAAASISSGLGDSYIIPFALALRAQPIHIGILSSVSGALYQIAQIFGSKAMRTHSRKKIVLNFVFLQALTWLLIAFVAFSVWKNLFDGYSIWILIILYSSTMFLIGIAYPPWFSWMGDITPDEKRGEYFSKRNRIVSIFGLAAILSAAFFLDYYETKGYLLLAFGILFSLSFLFRFISFLYLQTQYSPKFRQKKRDYFSLGAFLKKHDNFGKFAIYHGFFNLAIMIASPFFSVYMLEELGFSYLTYTTTIVSYTLFYLFFLPVAGKFSDKYGNRRLTLISNIFFILTPILYTLVRSPLSIILLPQLSSGIASAAAVISFSNFTYDAVSQRHRSICITYTNILIGIGTFIGAFLGGLIVNYFHPASVNPYIFVFIIAAILRFLVAVIFIPYIKEVKKVKRLPIEYTFYAHPISFIHTESARLMHLPKKILGKFKSLKLLQI